MFVGPSDNDLSFLGVCRCDNRRGNQVILVKNMETVVSLKLKAGTAGTHLGLSEIPTVDKRFIVQFDILCSNG